MISIFIYLVIGSFLSGIYTATFKPEGHSDSVIVALGWLFLIPFMFGYSMVKKKSDETNAT